MVSSVFKMMVLRSAGVTLGYTDTEGLFVERFIGKKSPSLGHSTSCLLRPVQSCH